MKNLFKASILFLAICNSAFAANQSIPKDRIIEEMNVYGDLVVVKISPAFENSQDCSSGSNSWLQLNLSEDPSGVLYSTLLAVSVSSKKVGFGIGGCNGQYPRIYRVDATFN